MSARSRTSLSLWLVVLGLLNVLAYTVAYGLIGGDAANGYTLPGGQYFLRGHFLHGAQGREIPTSQAVFIYSYIHSISLWITFGVVILAMLALARPHIIATMPEDSLLSGSLLVTVIAAAVLLFAGFFSGAFMWDFAHKLWVAWQPAGS